MRAGLAAGAIAAIIAALVSLPLHSPVDSVFNSATVAVAALALGLISGLLWNRLNSRPIWFVAALGGLFVVVLIVAFIGNGFLDRFVSFLLPLAAIVFVVCAALTPLLASYFDRPGLGVRAWTPVVGAIVALVLGFGLITQGDAESGDLALPPSPSATPSAPATATTAPPPSGATAQAFIVSEGSKITFTVAEELSNVPLRFDAVITSTGLSGTANLDGQPSVVTLDLHSLSSDQTYRDEYIRERLFSATPEAVFTVGQLPDLPQGFLDGEETNGELSGSLQIGEAVTPLVFQVEARRDGDVINVLGLTKFTWEQLGLTKPTASRVVYLDDEVRVQVLLVARSP